MKRAASLMGRILRNNFFWMLVIGLGIWMFGNFSFMGFYNQFIFQPLFETNTQSVFTLQRTWNQTITGQNFSTHQFLAATLEHVAQQLSGPQKWQAQDISEYLSRQIPGIPQLEDINWYLISPEGIIVQTDYPNDLGLDIPAVVPQYWKLLDKLQPGELRLEPLLFETQTNRPRFYGYIRLDDGSFLEIGLAMGSELVEQLEREIQSLVAGLPYLQSIDAYSILFLPYGDAPEISSEEKQYFKQTEDNRDFISVEKPGGQFFVYQNPILPEGNPVINSMLRVRMHLDFSKLILYRNLFLAFINVSFGLIAFVLLFTNYRIIHRFLAGLRAIIRSIVAFEKDPERQLPEFPSCKFSELGELNASFQQMAMEIHTQIHLQNRVNQNLEKNLLKQKKLEEELQEMVITDELTGIHNRRFALEYLERQLRNGPRPITVCFVDIDAFKKINDTHGHHMGDRVLKRIASILQSSIRAEDMVGRIGGDEFALAFISMEPAQARIVMERISTLLKNDPLSDELGSPLGISFGLSTVHSGERVSLEELLREADLKMYGQRKNKEG
ncbi:MAG TPA: GGDEF domain-containing protein [Thermotogota bacterium]|nr:GGDEF domain-containing protein [Thermotogota bacterium]HRW92783.1 GGDEF domain-containing protein [Thermotogota bacterium]